MAVSLFISLSFVKQVLYNPLLFLLFDHKILTKVLFQFRKQACFGEISLNLQAKHVLFDYVQRIDRNCHWYR